jgi:hypothetical protein
MSTSRTPRCLIGLLAAVALLAALPAAASALPRITTKPDPAAPAGKPPKVVFTLSGIVKGKSYSVSASQVSGQNGLNEQGYPIVCSSVVGRSLIYERAPATKFTLKPSPATYELKSNNECAGTYKGRAVMKRAGNSPKVILTFTLLMPSMRLTHVIIPRG